MKKLLLLIVLFVLVPGAQLSAEKVAIAIHGGAGTISPDKMTPEREKAIRAA